MNDRDFKIVTLIADGCQAKQIGDILDLSPRTVETYIEKIKIEYGAKTQANLIHILHQREILK